MTDTTEVLSNLQKAGSLHQSGKLQQAKNIYQQILEMEPENADALHLLGLISYQFGQSETAITLIKQALGISAPQFPSPSVSFSAQSGQYSQRVRRFSASRSNLQTGHTDSNPTG